MYVYEAFTRSISQDKHWKDSVHNHNNEHVVFLAICTLCGANEWLPRSS